MIDQVEFFVFATIISLFGCISMLVHLRKAHQVTQLRGRLGALPDREGENSQGLGDDEGSSLSQLLISSGIGWTTSDFWFRIILAGITGLMFGMFLHSTLLAIVLGAVGGAAVLTVVRRFSAKRLEEINTQMPQALEVMVMALRAGHALPNALAVAASEVSSPICEELRRVSDEQAFGRPIAQAIRALGDRLPGCATVNDFVVAVLVLEETGGNLIAVIERIIQNARTRTAYLLRLQALTAQARTSAKLLAFMPIGFALGACAIDDMYADMMLHDPAGQKLAIFAAFWWLLGVIFTRGLLKQAEQQ